MTTRKRLFAAAKAIYEREGLDALSIRAVGRQAGMSAMAIYRHFPDKGALIDALMDDGFSAWEVIIGNIDCDDPIVWLKCAVASYADFALTDPHRFDAAFLLPAPRARTFPNDFEAGRSRVINCMLAQIETAQKRGLLSDESPLQLTLLLSALAQGLVSMHRAGRFGNDEQFLASYHVAMDRLLDSFMKGHVLDRGVSKIGKRKPT